MYTYLTIATSHAHSRPTLLAHRCSAPAGGGILKNPSGVVPADPYYKGQVEPSDEYPPFTKSLLVCGITFVARDDVSDGFMLAQVSRALHSYPTNIQHHITRCVRTCMRETVRAC